MLLYNIVKSWVEINFSKNIWSLPITGTDQLKEIVIKFRVDIISLALDFIIIIISSCCYIFFVNIELYEREKKLIYSLKVVVKSKYLSYSDTYFCT